MNEPPDGRSTLADFGLTALVMGGGAAFLLGLITIGVGALTGRIPLLLGILLSLTALVAVAGLVITIITVRSGKPPRRPAAGRSGDL